MGSKTPPCLHKLFWFSLATSLFGMSPVRKYSYHRLGHEGWSDEEAEEERAFRRIRDFSRVNRFTIRKRLKLRIPGLRRFSRKRARLFSRVKISWLRAWKRLKNGQAHINDLFGGNFLVMQVSPAPFKCGERRFALNGMPPRYPLGKIA